MDDVQTPLVTPAPAGPEQGVKPTAFSPTRSAVSADLPRLADDEAKEAVPRRRKLTKEQERLLRRDHHAGVRDPERVRHAESSVVPRVALTRSSAARADACHRRTSRSASTHAFDGDPAPPVRWERGKDVGVRAPS